MNKEWLKSKGLDKWFQRDNLIVLVLAGILLFVIALPIEENGDKGKENVVAKSSKQSGATFTGEVVGNGGESNYVATSGDEFDYAAYLEERLESMLSDMDGVGAVSVMVTLESTEELVVEKDEPVKESNVQETDSQGGSRSTIQVEKSENTIYSTDGSVSEPYVVKKLLPKVEGVLVVAQGAGRGDINKNITEIIQALFDVDAHKIKVVAMDGES
ncbi:MAG: stage III sporulation protein AG [Eubacterium sp.]|nr:stage III sporulation protein AG [Eubacterium sp.]